MQTMHIVTRDAAEGKATPRAVAFGHKLVVLALAASQAAMIACGESDRLRGRESMPWSAWVEDAAVRRGYVAPGDFAQFGCPRGWMAVEETAVALRGGAVTTTYVGTDPPQHDATITCVAQKEFTTPPPYPSGNRERDPLRRPLTPVSLSVDADGITIAFRREVARGAPVYIGQDTPCGPRLIGVRLGDLLQWLVDPEAAPKRDFLGMVSGGCPEQSWAASPTGNSGTAR
jgi:hypothetical protein